MPITQLTPKGEIEQYIVKRTERMTMALAYNLQAVGEKIINHARQRHTYTDQTGNLTSSIGYVVAVDGKIVQTSSFDVVKSGAEGARQGRSFAEQLAQGVPHGIVLIVVAGKHYARYVSARGFDVIDSAEVLARQLIPKMLKQLGL